MLAPIRLSIVLLVLLGGVYPAVVTLIGGALFPYQAEGSLITRDGQMIGSALIAQAFDQDRYFHPRPSAAGDGGYDGMHSGGSNLGPTNQKLIDRVKMGAEALRHENPDLQGLPADLLTTSASGLDPDISPEGALAQVPRVARARSLSEAQVEALVRGHTQGPELGLFGQPRINVLELNLELDASAP
jgi:K+-transporting ATPase ATPase C chain